VWEKEAIVWCHVGEGCKNAIGRRLPKQGLVGGARASKGQERRYGFMVDTFRRREC